ncbi:NAD(P)/FAD-dependent oxidoreductase [Novosphingobium sp. KCTC 2891]|uniref:flavin-containing monooxygenase n=1 Tax=Novosphingobium sp. KCTC 2891 TaxID=2989730 RepID=UPI002222F9D5|nr:NAD(P)/FAD-dependent oxidoreductase [Novosphingobium sp. KCTC 2891]MCW1384237.1 NAD(P)/FAD-dependent oxidoreductase [Novosphingobium sp. KCTC 2891]
MAREDLAQHVDVVIVGAGISGVGSAYHLQDQCPDKSYVILERMNTFGGTWETHKYPGVRSDSDLYTFGYRFKPWTSAPIASAQAILDYMGEVIEENGIDKNIRYGHTITSCKWSSADNRWTVTARTADGAEHTFTCTFLWMCQGYYDHQVPYIPPEWKGVSDFKGLFIHAQLWDPNIDYTGKRVLVIGSGATAATVVPALAEKAGHVTILQRSPTYFFCHPNQNELADRLREIGIDEPTIHRIIRAQVMHDQAVMDKRCVEEPDVVVEELRDLVRAYVGPDFQFEPHFTPKYRPWQQRLAFCPDADLFRLAAEGKVSVVTDTIDRFTDKGVLTNSGELLEADIIVACTGFRLSVLGNIPFEVDGKAVDWADTVTYRGMMFTGVPNMLWVFGYFRASWTLRVDMLGDFVCRLLKHMDEVGAHKVEVKLRPEDKDMAILPWIEAENFNPNYLMRDLDKLPKRGDNEVWRHNQNYWAEREAIPAIDLDASEFWYDNQRADTRVLEAAE